MRRHFCRFLGLLAGGMLMHATLAGPIYRVAIVPQQPPATVVRLWEPLLQHLRGPTGLELRLVTYATIDKFHHAVATGRDDFLYVNPRQYVRAHAVQGYRPLARERERKLHGVLVVRRDSPIRSARELEGAQIVFPSPTAFAASVLVQSWLNGQGINFTPVYVRSHDSVYLNVEHGLHPAGGGILRTLDMQSPDVRNALRVLVTTAGFTAHAFAVHPRVPEDASAAVREALLTMETNEAGRAALRRLAIQGWTRARDADWNDVRQLTTEASP